MRLLSHRRYVALCGLPVFALALAVSAQAKPNFAGTWKMNAGKSDFGQMPAPDSRTDKITHADPDMAVAISSVGERGEFNYTMKYSTDGKETSNSIRDNPFKSVAKWDGDALMIDSKGSFGGNDVTIKAKWTLSEDGKTLTINSHFASSMGEGKQKLVLEKQ